MTQLLNNRYQLRSILGKGGMGTVYRAYDRLTSQEVALKQLQGIAGYSRTMAQNAMLTLAHEFKILATLRHPNIISVLDFGFDVAQQPYFTMTLLEHPQDLVEAMLNRTSTQRGQLLV